MSKIKLSPHASGNGNFTIAAPNSDTNRTLYIPAVDGTVLSTGSAGTIVQFKHEQFTTQFSTSSSTYQDAYSFTFTPTKATNNVLLQFTARMYHNTASRENRMRFLRDSTEIWEGRGNWNTGGALAFNGIIETLDTPGTTDEVTYKVQCRNETNGSGTIHFLYAADGDGYYNGPPMLRAWEITV